MSPAFVPVFGDCIRMLRKVLYAEKTGQPFLIAGSGTMGWDAAGANLIEAGDNAVSVFCGREGGKQTCPGRVVVHTVPPARSGWIPHGGHRLPTLIFIRTTSIAMCDAY